MDFEHRDEEQYAYGTVEGLTDLIRRIQVSIDAIRAKEAAEKGNIQDISADPTEH